MKTISPYVARIAPLLVPQADRAAVVHGERYPLIFGRPVTGELCNQIRAALAAMLLG